VYRNEAALMKGVEVMESCILKEDFLIDGVIHRKTILIPHLKDPYVIMGEEKSEIIGMMKFFYELFETIQYPTKQAKRVFFYVCESLESDARRVAKRATAAAFLFGEKKRDLVDDEVKDYQTRLRLQWMNDYKVSGKMTPELQSRLSFITKMESAVCYNISGIDISVRDCKGCEHKACHKASEA